jgi:peptidoglycan/LPS O-acetylase OafA/YrhL
VTGAHGSRALGALLLGGVFLGCSPILVRISHIGPIATAFWRLALALPPLVLSNGVALFRSRIDTSWMRVINHISGAIVFAFGLYVIASNL